MASLSMPLRVFAIAGHEDLKRHLCRIKPLHYRKAIQVRHLYVQKYNIRG